MSIIYGGPRRSLESIMREPWQESHGDETDPSDRRLAELEHMEDEADSINDFREQCPDGHCIIVPPKTQE